MGTVGMDRSARSLSERSGVSKLTGDAYERLVEASPDAILLIDPEGTILLGNGRAHRLWRAAVPGLEGRRLQDLVEPADRPAVEQVLLDMTRWDDVIGLDLRLRRDDGVTASVELNASPAEGVMGSARTLACILRDVTARKEKEEQLEAELRSSLTRLDATLKGTVRALGSVAEQRDPYTAGHQRKVAFIAGAIAERLGFSPDRTEGVRIASLLHDIGKVTVPIEILTKPGTITEHEWEIIRLHPGVAHGILREVDFPWPVAEVALQHHERLDGSGYPQHLRGEEMLLESRIVAVADVVQAMSSDRPYRPAHSVDDALAKVKRGRGVLFDPDVVDACLELYEDETFREVLA